MSKKANNNGRRFRHLGKMLLLAGIAGPLVPGVCGFAAADDLKVNAPPLTQMGDWLLDHGVTLSGSYTGEFGANVAGGRKSGQDYTDVIVLGADLDMAKIANIPGGTLHVVMTNRDGNNLAARAIDNSVSVQQIYGGGQTYHLTTLAWEQKLFDGHLDIEGGRTALGDDFIISPLYCYFQSNAACGNPSFLGKDASASFFPVAVWGGRAQFNLTKNIYGKIGIYDDDGTGQNPGEHGFDFSTTGSTGFLVPVEAGYVTTFADDTYPRKYDVGAVFDRTKWTDATGASQYGRTEIYGQVDQMIWRPDMGAQRGLYAFGFAGFGTKGSQASNYSVEGGLVDIGPTASRPLDSIGFLVNDMHYNHSTLQAVFNSRVAEGGTEFPESDLIMMEINYAWQATSWLNLMPNLQYIINPDGMASSTVPVKNLDNSFVIGFQLNIDLPTLFGIPTKS